MFYLRFALAVCVFSSSFSVFSSPWIEVGDERVRHNVQLLNDTGAFSVQLSAWPLMWSDLKLSLENMDRSQLSKAQLGAVRALEFELKYQTRQGTKKTLELQVASSRVLFRDFASDYQEQGRVRQTLDWDGSDLAARLRSNLVTEPGADHYEVQFDGSYFAGVLGEWVLGFGAIDRWWGPGHNSSLILSNNARPVPGVMLRTKSAQRFDSDWLSWIGDWHFTSFVGQLEGDRAVPHAKLTGMRLTFKPFDALELGLSRTMQWGGDGRSEDLETFFNSLTSEGENSEDQAGNQLGGLDVRLTLPSSDNFASAIYMQTIGEDEAGYLPSRRTYLFGIEAAVLALNEGGSLSSFIEYVNTAADPFGDEFFNTTYEHGVYQSGFRYKQRSIGSTFDNDARVLSFGSKIYRTNGDAVGFLVSRAELNRDGVVGGNTVSSIESDVIYVDLSYQALIFDGRLEFGVSYYSDHVPTLQEDIDETSFYGSWEYRF